MSQATKTSAKRIRKYKWNKSKTRRIYDLSADDVVLLIRSHIRRALGDTDENRSTVYAERGFFHIRLARSVAAASIADDYWRQALRKGLNLRRPSLGLAIRAMHGEVLT